MASSGKNKNNGLENNSGQNISPQRSSGRVQNHFVRFLIICVVFAGLISLLVYGVTAAEKLFFNNNDFFIVRKIEIEDPTMSWWHDKNAVMADFLEINLGSDNIFSFNLGDLRTQILENAFEVEKVEVSRKLPDVIHFKLLGRQPVAYVNENNGVWVVDASGVVIPSSHCLKIGKMSLPFIFSEGIEVNKLRSGNILGSFSPALKFLKIINFQYPGISVKSMVVYENEDIMDVYLLFENHSGIYKVRMPTSNLPFYTQKLYTALAQAGGNLGRMVLCEFKGQIIIK